MEQYYKIAGVTVAMDSFGRSAKQANAYLCEPAEPDITICSNREALCEKYPDLGLDYCEYLSTGSSFYTQLLNFSGMMLHASAVVLNGKAYLFSAPCGTGKSTHTRVWLRVFESEGAFILNDDKPALRLEDGVWYAYGTPWSGKHDYSRNVRVPVAGICFLHQAKENTITPFKGPRVMFSLLEQTVRPADPALRVRLIELLNELIVNVPIWQMGCNMEPEAALTSYEAMSKAAMQRRM